MSLASLGADHPPAGSKLEPPQPLIILTGAALAILAGTVAAVSGSAGCMPRGRRAVLVESLTGPWRQGLANFHASESVTRARWAVLQAASLSGSILVLRLGGQGWLLVAMLTLGLHIVCAHLVAGLVRATADRSLPAILTLLRPLDILVAPLADPFVALSNQLVKPLSMPPPSGSATESEVEMLVTEGELSGALGHEQSEMIRNVLDFGDTEAGELMVPRPQVVAIDVTSTMEDVLSVVGKHEHTRYPVYRDRMDNVIGILHVKDIFLFGSRSPGVGLPMQQLLRPAVFIPETQLAESVLRQMRAGRHHMAIVVDEYGGMAGVLTLEDLLEEIVGEIRDEHDDDEPPVVELSNGHWVVDASMPIAELNRAAGIDLPDGDDYHSLGGFIIEVMGRVPEPGAVLERLGHRFLIRTSDERHISKVEIVPADLTRASLPLVS